MFETMSPEKTVFVVLSFEGPDPYSQAGGLGVRVSKLSQALAEQGYETHLFFVGDPEKEGMETAYEGRLILHRWCQWISEYHPFGVYDGEEGKLNDFTGSVPEFVVHSLAEALSGQGKNLVLLAEEWHTAETVCRVGELLAQRGLRKEAILLWNANNTYSFSRINWDRLSRNAVITTVSNYMRQLMRGHGVEPLVIPNGIQRDLTQPVEKVPSDILHRELETDFVLFKMGRFDPSKGWIKAMETASRLKGMGYSLRFIMRGGMEPYGEHVFAKAQSLGLSVQDVDLSGQSLEGSIRELLAARYTDVLNITSFIPHDFSRIIFASSDAVLADSLHEPFGLVGLEAMASGGVAFVGNTGEDYARDLDNSVVLETSKSAEAAASVLYMHHYQRFTQRLRQRARSTGTHFTWDRIITNSLQPKLQRLSWEKQVA